MIRITDEKVQPFEAEHIETVRSLAPECTLLLKKDGVLPIEKPCSVALYGSGARRTVKGGTGSGDVNVRHFTTIEEGMEKAGFNIISKSWLDSYDDLVETTRREFIANAKKEAKELGINATMYVMGKVIPTPEYDFPLDMSGDMALYILSRDSGEGADRTAINGDIGLTNSEIRDIIKLNEQYERFVLVLNVGGMVNLKPVENVKNILLLGQLGTPVGDVLADILLGKSYPSGKLTMTWADIIDYPSTDGFGDADDTFYKEGIYVGYRYFDTVDKTPLYPFGFGLSFTEFKTKVKTVELKGDKIVSTVSVTNIGNYKGKEIVQAYYSAPVGKLDKPYQELVAFKKTKELEPNESADVILEFSTSDMASYDEEKAEYLLEKGDYLLRIGNSSDNTEAAAIVSLEQDVVVEKLKNICKGQKIDEIKPAGRVREDTTGLLRLVLKAENIKPSKAQYSALPKEIPQGEAVLWKDVVNGNKTVDDFVGGLDEKQLIYLCMGLFDENGSMGSMIGNSAHSVAGAAGETTKKLDNLGVPRIVMADGPAGLRLTTRYKVVGGMVKGLDSALSTDLLEPEQIEKLKAMMGNPSEEERNAPINYTYCIAIPIGTALAQSWNTELCETMGDIVASEMELFGIHLWLAPAMNIQRSPLCGRNFEYYSEDPLVSGFVAAGITNGVQKHKGCGVTIKHFACNNQETNRVASNSILSERALREIYLKGFEICVKKSQPESIMSSYNLVNGEHTNNSKDLITHVLRDEWGFEGIVMTDWFAADDVMARGSSRPNKNPAGSASGCIHAGNDLTMPGIPPEFEEIEKALKGEGRYPITKAELQLTAKRVLKEILKLV